MAEDLTTETDTPRTRAKKQTPGTVLVTITKFGDGKVSTGKRDETGDVFAKAKDILEVAPEIATELETRGLAETE